MGGFFLLNMKLGIGYADIYCIVEDLIEIQDVALLNSSEEWTDDVYSLSASVMDGVSV